MGKFRGLDTEEGWIKRRFSQVERDQQEQASARRLVLGSAFVQGELTGINLPDDNFLTDYLTTVVLVPDGFKYALVNVFASAGTTFIAGPGTFGNVGIRPVVGSLLGPGISNGKNSNGGLTNVSSALASRIPVVPGGSFIIKANAIANGDPRVALTGNVRLSASVIFTRA